MLEEQQHVPQEGVHAAGGAYGADRLQKLQLLVFLLPAGDIRDRQTLSRRRDRRGVHKSPQHLLSMGWGQKDRAGDTGTAALEVAMDTFGLLLMEAKMMSRLLFPSLDTSSVEMHEPGQERAGRAGGQAV